MCLTSYKLWKRLLLILSSHWCVSASVNELIVYFSTNLFSTHISLIFSIDFLWHKFSQNRANQLQRHRKEDALNYWIIILFFRFKEFCSWLNTMREEHRPGVPATEALINQIMFNAVISKFALSPCTEFCPILSLVPELIPTVFCKTKRLTRKWEQSSCKSVTTSASPIASMLVNKWMK